MRHGYHVSAAAYVLRTRLLAFHRPGCNAMVHRHSRVSCGYFRFIAVGAYMLYRLVWLSTASEFAKPLFNDCALALFVAVLLMEILEDMVVLLRLLPLDPWRSSMKHAYALLSPFHPKQVMCKDHRGLHPHAAPLRLHGSRPISRSINMAIMHIVCSVCLTLMWFPLGTGFWIGICPEPTRPSERLSATIWWPRPLTCA